MNFVLKVYVLFLKDGLERKENQQCENEEEEGKKSYEVKKYEVDVLHADKLESLLQVDSIVFDGFAETCPN